MELNWIQTLYNEWTNHGFRNVADQAKTNATATLIRIIDLAIMMIRIIELAIMRIRIIELAILRIWIIELAIMRIQIIELAIMRIRDPHNLTCNYDESDNRACNYEDLDNWNIIYSMLIRSRHYNVQSDHIGVHNTVGKPPPAPRTCKWRVAWAADPW